MTNTVSAMIGIGSNLSILRSNRTDKVYVDNKDRQRPVAPACFAPTPLVTIQAKGAPGLSAELASPLRMHRIGRMNTPNPASFVAPCP